MDRSSASAGAPPLDRLLELSPEPLGPDRPVRMPVGNVRLWFGALGGPIAWAVHLMTMYPLVELACRWESAGPLYAVSAVLFAIAATAALTNWRALGRMRSVNGSTVPRRARFMAYAGLLGAVLFATAILVGTLPVFFDDPCQLHGRRPPSLVPYL